VQTKNPGLSICAPTQGFCHASRIGIVEILARRIDLRDLSAQLAQHQFQLDVLQNSGTYVILYQKKGLKLGIPEEQ